MSERINYVDNLRTITVSLLIVFHLAMSYNTWNEPNYIFFEPVNLFASIVVFIAPWFMPLMFLLAGVSAFYSLKKRSFSVFIKERLLRLGLPLIFGIFFLNPVLSYIADITHNGYKGNYIEHYAVFFQKFTDLSGYDGTFTLGHLWFIAVLLVISIVSCAFAKLFQKTTRKSTQNLINALLIVAAVASFNVKILGKPLITYFCTYLSGYFLFSSQKWIKKIAKFKWLFVFSFLIFSILNVLFFVYAENFETLQTVFNYLSFACGIPALICLGKDYLDYSTVFSRYCSKLSYVFYIVHFPAVVLCQYFFSLTGMNCFSNFFVSLVTSSLITCIICWLWATLKSAKKAQTA